MAGIEVQVHFTAACGLASVYLANPADNKGTKTYTSSSTHAWQAEEKQIESEEWQPSTASVASSRTASTAYLAAPNKLAIHDT